MKSYGESQRNYPLVTMATELHHSIERFLNAFNPFARLLRGAEATTAELDRLWAFMQYPSGAPRSPSPEEEAEIKAFIERENA